MYDPNICWNCHTTNVKNNYQIKMYFLSLILPLYERYLQQEMRKVNVAVEMKRDSCNKTTGNQSFRHGLVFSTVICVCYYFVLSMPTSGWGEMLGRQSFGKSSDMNPF
jgi:hypothetical protein